MQTQAPPAIAVDIFIPCFIDQLFPETGFNMVKVLEKLGCNVHYNPNQTCCGQPAMNAGFFDDAVEVATKFIDDFSGERFVVAPSASCVGMVRNAYSKLFEGSLQQAPYNKLRRRVYEFTEFLTMVLKVEKIEGASLKGIAAYHDSCSALRECGIFAGPRKLLSNVSGLDLRNIADNDNCCGFGGTFAVKFEAISTAMAAQKLENVIAVGAEYIISTDSSCLLQLDAYIRKEKMNIRCLHVADVLASGW
ncbi:MAG: (Fe-S)-binding protein [Bacteroidota bacterium]